MLLASWLAADRQSVTAAAILLFFGLGTLKGHHVDFYYLQYDGGNNTKSEIFMVFRK